MKFFLDTAEIEQIQHYAALGLVDGVTTNPSLIAKSGGDFLAVIQEIAQLIPGPVSAECLATDVATMEQEGRYLAGLAENIAVKVPLTVEGLKVCKVLSDDGIVVNVTLCFSAAQALLAAKVGARFISPFVGRLDDLGECGMDLVASIREIYDQYAFDTEILVASVRPPLHVVEAATIGADVATMPPKVLAQLYNHPLTDKGLAAFLADWDATGKPRKIL
ncbi:MAG: fructose-6-phosphate aldolase [Alphaproteobacteria bacterium]|nr:fructose-6-phosphate aldolase [Alphaproteobacteria bacterium]